MKNKISLLLITLALIAYSGLAYAAVIIDPVFHALWLQSGFYVGSAKPIAGNKTTSSLGGSATIDFASTIDGRVFSSSITVTGAKAGDPCFVGVPTAAAALKAEYGCLVDAADSVKVWFHPDDRSSAQVSLVSASPSTQTATVSAGSICTASPLGTTAAIAAGGIAWSVTSTTLTLTGPNTVTTPAAYSCAAPVDPASGTYYVRVMSSQ